MLRRAIFRSRSERRFTIATAVVAVLVTTSSPFVPAAVAAGPITLAGVVNTYQAVGAISGATVTLAGTRAGASTGFAAGDQVLVIQMTGSNPAATTSSLGDYEVATVAVATSTNLTLTAGLSRAYAPATERVQVVRIVGGSGVTTLAGTVTALPWTGRVGGVVALAGDQINLAGQAIDVSGDGFTNTAAPAQTVYPANTVAAGDPSGRGTSGAATLSLIPAAVGKGGGGVGGGGGAGGTSAAAGGSVGGGGAPTSVGGVASGTDGGGGAPPLVGHNAAGGGGGGGGIIGGGGGGGGGSSLVTAPGGGGGVAGGGGGGHGDLTDDYLAGGGGGGIGSVGEGGDGQPGGWLLNYGSAGGGGGSYGGGGASGGLAGLLAAGFGGGGGGSWTGGGAGGWGSDSILGSRGGSGNAPVGSDIPDSASYLNDANPRLMLGGAGGRGSSDAGATAGGVGGGIVFLRTANLTGGGTIRANGAPGTTPTGGVHSGSGGGGGGQVRVVATSSIATGLRVSADGGAAGRPSGSLLGVGAPGGGGGAGGVWLAQSNATRSCGTDASALGVVTSVAGGASSRAPITGVGGGAGGTGLVCTSSAVASFAVGDRVWRDANANGVQDAGEPGVAGVTVRLFDSSGATVTTTTTDSTGRFLFDRLPAGTYRLGFGLVPNCTYTIAGAGDPGSGSDADSFSGSTADVLLATGAANVRSPVAGDGPVQASSINSTVDAGLVCSTTSATQLGAYSNGQFTDLQGSRSSPLDGASGVAVLSTAADGQSASLLLAATGIGAGGSGASYAARLNFGPCVAGFPAAAGLTYNTDLLDGNFPPVVSRQTEAWLDLNVDASGRAIATTTVPFIPSAAARSIVLYGGPTSSAGLPTGPAAVCLPFVIG